ncbi:hypothetical protein H4R18_000125 [Coemansia javaensis]|uniref:Adhesin domain-containing protein n=1 Tax=Coemansia javaensis TaxID=2761396 RepID=A0A9W8LL18_9FUNG|nr:hypothetical protein H4R18_000125 [Coemansia javaensis]
MNDEKRAAGPRSAVCLEAGGAPAERRRCSRAKKALGFLACFFVANLVLRAVLGGPGMLHRLYQHGLQWGCGGGGGGDGAHAAPQKHGDRRPHIRPFRTIGLVNRINPEALTSLVNGELPVGRVSDLFRHSAELCVPFVPVAGLERISFSPSEFGRISHQVAGGIGTDIRVVAADGDEATLEVSALASSQKIADQIKVTATKGDDGAITLQLDGPKWLGKGDCAYAKVVLAIPAAVGELPALRNSFVYGTINVDRDLARRVSFGAFEVDAAVSRIAVPPIRAGRAVVNSVAGGVRGYFHVGESLAIHSVRSDIDVAADVRHARAAAAITAESVTGQVALRVAGGFDGSFSVRTVSGAVDVQDAGDGSSRLHFDRDRPRLKSGTFGPADSSRAGDSTLSAAAVTGNVRVEFF